jgi:photosystem II stability/assembly factor-like uncharacterized protein
MTPEHQVVDRLTGFYREMEQALPDRPPPWRPERRTARRSSWRMQAVATAGVLLVAVGVAVLLQHGRRQSIVQPVTPTGAMIVPISTASFLNAKDGVVITERGLFITHDGGQNWHLQTDLQLDWRGINDVRFIDPDHIVIVSSSNGVASFLHSTADGGAHWQTNPIAPLARPEGQATVFFLNAREGWQESDSGLPAGKLVPGGPNPKGPDAVALYHTTDAGAHWAQLWRVGAAQSSSPGPAFTGFPDRLLFTDSMHGFMGTFSYDNVGRLYVTRDGGKTWQVAVIPAPPGGWPSGCCGKVITSPAVTMFGNRGFVAEGDASRGAVYSTSDGGQSWGNPRLLPTGAVQPYFLTPSNWWALVGSTVYETVDAGASWKHVAVHLPSGLGLEVLASDLVTETHVIWGVGGGLLAGVPVSTCLQFFDGPGCNFLIRSTDGGATWTLVKLPAA